MKNSAQTNYSPDALAAMNLLCDRNPFEPEQMSHTRYVMLMVDFLDNKGEEAMKKLAGFYLYCINEMEPEKQQHAIRSTFSHDLHGAKDEFLLPRSDNYLQFWEQYKPTPKGGAQ